MTIHILGAGNIGCLIAYAAAALPKRYSPALLLRNSHRLREYIQGGSRIVFCDSDGLANSRPVTVEALCPGGANPPRRIENLVISTKTHQTVSALKPWIGQLSPDSNVLFLQNGMGSVEAAISEYWSSGNTPRIYVGVTTHGVFRHHDDADDHDDGGRRFRFTHAGKGDIKYARYTNRKGPSELEDFMAISSLNATLLEYAELRRIQYHKLIVNCCINPLTTLLDCPNGQLNISRAVVESLYPAIIEECVQVIKRKDQVQLDPGEMLNTVCEVAAKTAANSSSMRQDMKRAPTRPTEIDYINGWIVDQGEKLNIATPVNKMLVAMIQAKSEIS